jgi:hypothetical protein
VGVSERGDVDARVTALINHDLMLALDLIAEEKIREAMRDGAFDDLPGAGKPLALDDDRLVPEDVRMAYRILRNAGFVPPEVEARNEVHGLRELVAVTTEDAARRRALARIALIETHLEARGGTLSRASRYYDRIIGRFEGG